MINGYSVNEVRNRNVSFLVFLVFRWTEIGLCVHTCVCARAPASASVCVCVEGVGGGGLGIVSLNAADIYFQATCC